MSAPLLGQTAWNLPSDNDDFELTPTSEVAARLNEAEEERKARAEKRKRLDGNVPDYL